MSKISIDMNDSGFQKDFFALDKRELASLIKTSNKIRQLTWPQFYEDNGLKWEAISLKNAKESEKIYSFRFSQKYRAVALRQGNSLQLMSLHTDHDSAYN